MIPVSRSMIAGAPRDSNMMKDVDIVGSFLWYICYFLHNSQKATALAAATLRESTFSRIGIRMV